MSNHFGSYVRSISLHFCKRLVPGLEPMTSWSQGNSFIAAPGFLFINEYVTLKKKRVSTKNEQKTVTLTKIKENI
jgi:hypothetical protein